MEHEYSPVGLTPGQPLQAVMKLALDSEYGIAVSTANRQAAAGLRRKMYAYRERLGSSEFKTLSFIVKPNGELWIVRRDVANAQPASEFSVRPQQEEEVPSRILARGKRKPGLMTLLALSQLEKKP